jgi:hypothetical protein
VLGPANHRPERNENDMNIYTPDEQLHRQHAAQQQRDRFIMRYLSGANPRERKHFAHEIETAIIDRLRAEKHYVSRAAANEHYDLSDESAEIARSAPRLQQKLWEIAVERLRAYQPDWVLFDAAPSFPRDLILIPGSIDGITYNAELQDYEEEE